jgi:lipid A 3-O-deacylase
MKHVIALFVSFGFAPIALAGPIAEVRGSLLAHNLAVLETKNAGKEASPNIGVEILFTSPRALAWAGAPKPYLSASVNSAGDTSFAALGLEWQAQLGAGWRIEPGLGYAFHTGETNNPFRAGDPRAAAFNRDKVLLGSDDLFRVSLGLSRMFGSRWAAGIVWEHYSHGQILGEGRNQGMDEVGLRMSRRIGV